MIFLTCYGEAMSVHGGMGEEGCQFGADLSFITHIGKLFVVIHVVLHDGIA
jgi:hypothetical protein